jgi:hypothetical protein
LREAEDGSHQSYKDKWIPLDDLTRVKNELALQKNILNQHSEFVMTNTNKGDVQVFRGLDIMSIDVSENEGECTLVIVGEYYCYSREYWATMRHMMMAMSASFFLTGFFLNFSHIGLVRLTPFQKLTLLLTAFLELFDLVTDFWQTYTSNYFLESIENVMIFSVWCGPTIGITTWILRLKGEVWFNDFHHYWFPVADEVSKIEN